MAKLNLNGENLELKNLHQHSAYKWFVLANIMLGTFMAVLDVTIVNVGLPKMFGRRSMTKQSETTYREMRLKLHTLAQEAAAIEGSYTGNLAETKELLDLVRKGAVPPIPIGRRPMSAATETIEDLRKGRIVGRVVLTP